MSRLLFFSCLLLIFVQSARCESPRKAAPSEVDRLIQQLGSDSFAEREAASKALDAVGESALEALQKAAREDRDAEVRRRAKGLVELLEARLYGELRCFKGHTDCVLSVSFSPDGKQALS